MNSITRECKDCPDLQEVLKSIDCTLLDMTKNKYNSTIYGVDNCFDESLFETLVTYKRIVTSRLYNPTYPCGVFSNNEILSKIKLLSYKENCSNCPECEEIITTTTTQIGECCSFLVNTASPSGVSILYPYSYIDCNGDIVTGTISQYQALNICALKNTININPLFTIYEHSPGCTIVPESCTCSEIINEEMEPGTVPYLFSYSDCDGNNYSDILLTEGMNTFICVKPSTLLTNFKFSLINGASCIDTCP